MNIKGLSLVEFMIATTLGALIITGVANIYLSNKNTYLIQDALSRLVENARFAHYFLNKDIRMAGYQGCAGQTYVTVNNIVRNPSHTETSSQAIMGYQGGSSSFTPSVPSNLTNRAIANSDVFEIRMASETDIQIRQDMNRPNNPVHVVNRLGIQAGDIVLITDCNVADIFKVGANVNASVLVHTVTENTTNDLSTSYTTDAKIFRYYYYSYYVKNSGRRNANNEMIPVLVRQNSTGVEEEIAEGVEQIRILYGVDTNNNASADTYQTATEVNAANNWPNVVSLQYRLLFATTENVAARPTPYQFNNQTLTPTDRKLRREWIGYVTLRNRGMPS